MELIPAIDLRDGRCVRLLQGDFAQETRYSVDPVELAQQYRDLRARLVNLNVLGGCCGTDFRHVEQICFACEPVA